MDLKQNSQSQNGFLKWILWMMSEIIVRKSIIRETEQLLLIFAICFYYQNSIRIQHRNNTDRQMQREMLKPNESIHTISFISSINGSTCMWRKNGKEKDREPHREREKFLASDCATQSSLSKQFINNITNGCYRQVHTLANLVRIFFVFMARNNTELCGRESEKVKENRRAKNLYLKYRKYFFLFPLAGIDLSCTRDTNMNYLSINHMIRCESNEK